MIFEFFLSPQKYNISANQQNFQKKSFDFSFPILDENMSGNKK